MFNPRKRPAMAPQNLYLFFSWCYGMIIGTKNSQVPQHLYEYDLYLGFKYSSIPLLRSLLKQPSCIKRPKVDVLLFLLVKCFTCKTLEVEIDWFILVRKMGDNVCKWPTCYRCGFTIYQIYIFCSRNILTILPTTAVSLVIKLFPQKLGEISSRSLQFSSPCSVLLEYRAWCYLLINKSMQQSSYLVCLPSFVLASCDLCCCFRMMLARPSKNVNGILVLFWLD